MDALVSHETVWQTQYDGDETLGFENMHCITLDSWKKRAKPAMIFFVEYCWRHYNEKPRCSVCGCLLGGPGQGHLQSRYHLRNLKNFIRACPLSSSDRDDYWQVVRHRSGAARINHIDLEIQTCVGEPPPYKMRKEELHGAGVFVQWEIARSNSDFREPPCVLKVNAEKGSRFSNRSVEADTENRVSVGLRKEKNSLGDSMLIAALHLEPGYSSAERKTKKKVTVDNTLIPLVMKMKEPLGSK